MSITVRTKVDLPLEKAWLYFTTPDHIEKWNAASPDWYCPKAENDLKVNSEAMQQTGWQAILDNFKLYVTTI